MALTFELVNLVSESFEKLDLAAGVLRVRSDGYEMSTAASRAQYDPNTYGAGLAWQGLDLATDTLHLVGVGTEAQLRAALDQLARLLELARAYHRDPTNPYPTLLRWNAPTETQRAALVYDGSFSVGGGALDVSLARGAVEVTLVLTRAPLWEDATAGNTWSGSATSFGAWGGEFLVDTDGSYTDAGSAPTRLALFGPYNSANYIESVWVGLKRDVNNFSGYLEAEKGTLGADSSVVGGAAYSSGSAVACNFSGSATLCSRFTLSLIQGDPLASTYTGYVGRYLVLARVYLSAGVVGMQLYTGDKGAQVTPAAETVIFDEASTWRLVPLGEVQIPARGYHNESFYPGQTWDLTLRSYTFDLRAEKISGSPTLTIDALALVPAQHMWTARVDDDATTIQYSQERDGRVTTYASSGSTSGTLQMYGVAEFTARDFAVPNISPQNSLGGRMAAVTFYERPTGHVLTDACGIAWRLVHRWHSYRSDDV